MVVRVGFLDGGGSVLLSRSVSDCADDTSHAEELRDHETGDTNSLMDWRGSALPSRSAPGCADDSLHLKGEVASLPEFRVGAPLRNGGSDFRVTGFRLPAPLFNAGSEFLGTAPWSTAIGEVDPCLLLDGLCVWSFNGAEALAVAFIKLATSPSKAILGEADKAEDPCPPAEFRGVTARARP